MNLITLSKGSTRYFFQKGLIFLQNGKTAFFCFLSERSSKHVESILSTPYRGCVAHCFKLLHNVPYWQNNPNHATEVQYRGSQLVFNFFSIRFECS